MQMKYEKFDNRVAFFDSSYQELFIIKLLLKGLCHCTNYMTISSIVFDYKLLVQSKHKKMAILMENSTVRCKVTEELEI